MSKVVKTVATVAGAIALVATGIGAAGGLGIIAAATATKAAAIAGVASTALGTIAQLTAPKPVARGSSTNTIIAVEPPRPYMMGESFSGGILRHRVGYGPTTKKVPNPYLWEVKVFSGAGPVEALVQEQFDFSAIGLYYTGFYDSHALLGARPETPLDPPLSSPAPQWTADHRLSGCAAIGSNYFFDKDGEVWASGLPVHGAIWKGEKAYDPRLDSTYPGGSGTHRLDDEDTWEYTTNPALHAATYAYGRRENGTLIFGLGLDSEGIDWAAVVDWANDCDANSWEVHGTIYEGGAGADLSAQRKQNLNDICAAGGARWLTAGALLSFDWHRPRVSLATLTDDDILEEGASATALQSIRDRMNGVRPQYVSPAHNWEQITADEIIGTTYRTEDGQALTQTWALNLVKDAGQAGELASYALVDSREIGPIEITAKAEWRFYKPGETITVDSTLLGYTGPAVIVSRDLDPQTFAVRLVLKSETAAKHTFALGKTATPPPTPVITQTQEERDLAAYGAITPRAVDVEYDDGTTAESLKPGESGSTRNVARGTYVAGTTYELGDEVLLNGSSYRLIVATSTGNPPPDASRWELFAEAGGGSGADGLTITLTNENHSVATDSVGAGGDFTDAGGTFEVRRGATLVSPTFSVAAKTPAIVNWINIDSSTGVYTVTDPAVDLATATLRATFDGVDYDRTYTLTKAKQGLDGNDGAAGADGNDGADAVNSAQVAMYKRASTQPGINDRPTSTNQSYTFATGVLSPSLSNGWRSEPEDSNGEPLWARYVTASGSGASASITSADWSDPPKKIVEDGAAGADGTDGADAKTLTVLSNRQTIFYDSAGNPTPATQTITFSTNKQNTTATVNWTVEDADGVARTPVASFLSSATGDSVTMTEAQFGSARNGTSGVIVTATLTDGTTISDKISVTRVQDGAGGTNGNDAITLTIGSDRQTIFYDSAGDPSPLTQTTTFTANRQNTTNTVNWTITDAAGVAQTPVTTYLSAATGDVVTMTEAQFDSARNSTSGVIVTATVTDGTAFTDQISVTRVQDGAVGAQGTPGLNNASVILYQRGSSAPADPSGTVTYTFADGSVTGSLNGWSKTPPAGTDPLYAIVGTASSTGATDTIAPSEWSAAEKILENALNVAKVYLYQRASSTPAVPSATLTYTFATDTLSGALNGWTQTVPANNGDPLYITTASAASVEATDDIPTGEWAAPEVFSQDGDQGPAVEVTKDGDFTFTDGVLDPNPQTITFTAALYNVSGTINWTTSPNIKTGTGSVFTVNNTEMGDETIVFVTATCDGVARTIPLRKQPDPLATVIRDASGNLIKDPVGGDGWRYAGGALSTLDPQDATSDELPATKSRSFTGASDKVYFAESTIQGKTRFAVAPGNVYRFGVWVYKNSTANGDVELRIERSRASSSIISEAPLSIEASTEDLAVDALDEDIDQIDEWVWLEGLWVCPEGVSYAVPMLQSDANLTTGKIYYALPFFGLAADVRATIDGPGTVPIFCDEDGAINMPLPQSIPYWLLGAGNEAYTGNIEWEVDTDANAWSGAVPSITTTAGGTLRINSTPDAVLTTVTLRARIKDAFPNPDAVGPWFPDKTVTIQKVTAQASSLGSAAAGNSTAFSANLNNVTGSSSFSQTSETMTVTLPTGVTQAVCKAVDVGLFISHSDLGGPSEVEFQWQWRDPDTANPWADFGTATQSSIDPDAIDYGFLQSDIATPGAISCSATKTGLTAGDNYEFRLMGRISSGTIRSVHCVGTAFVKAQ